MVTTGASFCDHTREFNRSRFAGARFIASTLAGFEFRWRSEINIDNLYREVQEDLNRIAGPLFEFGQQQVRKRGAYLPFGATLSVSGEIGLEAASAGEEFESSVEVLPVLHEGLRATVKQDQILAVAVCEWVKITREGSQTDAMKVLVEHKRGLTVALYVPCQKKFMKGWQFNPMFAMEAEPEVKAWDRDNAS